MLLNINIPDVPFEQLDGFEVTRLGQRHKSEPAIRMKDPKDRTVYWVGPAGAGADAGPGTDFHAVFRKQDFRYPVTGGPDPPWGPGPGRRLAG